MNDEKVYGWKRFFVWSGLTLSRIVIWYFIINFVLQMVLQT